MVTCGDCCGTGIAGHPDIGYTCYKCGGKGGYEMKQIYNQDGIRAEADYDTVSVYVEGTHTLTMTTGDFMRIAIALTDADIVAVLPTQDREYDL